MGLKESTLAIRVPLANREFQAAFGQRIHFLHPLKISGYLPLAIHFHDSAELSVSRGVKIVLYRAIGQSRTKVHMPFFIHGAFQFLFPQSALQRREKVRQGLRIIPNVGAGAVTAARIRKASLPGPNVAIFLAKNRRRFENPQIGGYCIQDVGGESRGKQSFLEARVRARKEE